MKYFEQSTQTLEIGAMCSYCKLCFIQATDHIQIPNDENSADKTEL